MNILLATDGSSSSDMSLQMIKALRLPSHTEYRITTVIPEYTFLEGQTIEKVIKSDKDREMVHRTREEKALKILEKPTEMLKTISSNVKTSIRTGNPAIEIITEASDIKADMVVIGAKGSSSIRSLSLGRTAERVMRHSDTSVLLVREDPISINRVIIACDGSAYTDNMCKFLIDLPMPKQAEIYIMTSLRSYAPFKTGGTTFEFEMGQEILEKIQKGEEISARKFLKMHKKKFEEKGYTTRQRIFKGHPAEGIITHSEEEIDPNIIVIGAKGLSHRSTYLLGSVTKDAARASKHSVLIYRDRTKEQTLGLDK